MSLFACISGWKYRSEHQLLVQIGLWGSVPCELSITVYRNASAARTRLPWPLLSQLGVAVIFPSEVQAQQWL
jgi:hypothetical protein